MVETCAYHNAEKPKIVRDQIAMNIVSDTVREKLLRESGLTLEMAVDMHRSMEATTQYLTCMAASSTTTKECDSEAASSARDKRIQSTLTDIVLLLHDKARAKGLSSMGQEMQLLQQAESCSGGLQEG